MVTSINDGHKKVIPIHSMFRNFEGIHFLGKLHNTKQHIQFIRFLLDDLVIPSPILPKFLTSYNPFICGCKCENAALLPIKKQKIKENFHCDWYLFEICSLKLYEKDGYQVQCELTNDYSTSVQTLDDLLQDLATLRRMLPNKILFQVHFRPNIIYGDPAKKIDQRELIYETVSAFCKKNENTFVHDPSVLIKTNLSYFDGDTHFTEKGSLANFHYIYENYLTL